MRRADWQTTTTLIGDTAMTSVKDFKALGDRLENLRSDPGMRVAVDPDSTDAVVVLSEGHRATWTLRRLGLEGVTAARFRTVEEATAFGEGFRYLDNAISKRERIRAEAMAFFVRELEADGELRALIQRVAGTLGERTAFATSPETTRRLAEAFGTAVTREMNSVRINALRDRENELGRASE